MNKYIKIVFAEEVPYSVVDKVVEFLVTIFSLTKFAVIFLVGQEGNNNE